jgi:hypothetical protein
MRDEVFHVGGQVGNKLRSIFIEDELYWLMVDVLRARGYHKAMSHGSRAVAEQVSADHREQVWILEAGTERPKAVWVVSAAGRRELADLYPRQTRTSPVRRARRKRPTSAGSDCSPPRKPMPGFLPLPTDDDTEES